MCFATGFIVFARRDRSLFGAAPGSPQESPINQVGAVHRTGRAIGVNRPYLTVPSRDVTFGRARPLAAPNP
jgi:hypothetical protein